MAAKVILHIGQQKSGTTHLQDVLGRCAGALEAAGISYPPSLREYLPDAIENHERAFYGLLGTEFPWVSATRAAHERRKWDRLAERVRDCDGTVLLSAEALSVVRADAVRRIVDELGGPPPEIVITARPLGRTLPSLWQQHVRNGRTTSLPRYLTVLARQRALGAEAIEEEHELHLWRAFALGGLVRRWAAVVGPERVTVVVHGGGPHDLLWTRFAAAVGASGVTVPDGVLRRRTHESLRLAQAQIMVRLNARLAEDGWDEESARALRTEIILRGGAIGPRPGVPEASAALVARWSDEDIAGLRDSGARVLGDPGELRYDPGRDTLVPAGEHDLAEAAAAAVLAVTDRDRYAPRQAMPRQRRWVRR
ncbi:hypothetical protein [Actinomadura flavalba]|uniref:hypothetical protein n=1 Tax=Actinomadura flavalba TaxID=1120938 RepID=UPI00036FEE58|nr:hypothetical protein [Actinomadura flavalba]